MHLKIIDAHGRMAVKTVDLEAVAPEPPVIVGLDPNSGRPGDVFTIVGRNFVSRNGGDVPVIFARQAGPIALPDPGPLAIIGVPTATQVMATVPDIQDEGRVKVMVIRSDDAEAASDEDFQITLL